MDDDEFTTKLADEYESFFPKTEKFEFEKVFDFMLAYRKHIFSSSFRKNLVFDKVMNYMNNFVCMVKLSKPLFIVEEFTDNTLRYRKRFNEYKESDFLVVMRNTDIKLMKPIEKAINGEIYTIEKETFVCNVGKLWLSHPSRREYDNINFYPAVNRDWEGFSPEKLRVFNTFNGFTLSKENMKMYKYNKNIGDITPWLDHIKTIWCSGNIACYEYVLNWFAHLLQNPQNKLKQAIVVKSTKEGAGKGIIISKLKDIIGSSFKHITDSNAVLGNHATTMRDCVLCFLDEAVWGGNKQDAGKLKALITESTFHVNPKGLASYDIDSYAHCIFASNEDWVIPAGPNARRYLVLNLDERYGGIQNEQSEAYFKKLRMVSAETIADFLYKRDVSKWNSAVIPDTQGLVEQKLLSLNSVAEWWYGIISEGRIANYEPEPEHWDKNDLWKLYYHGDTEKYKVALSPFCKTLKQISKFTEHRVGKERKRVYKFAPFEEQKDAFATYLGTTKELLFGNDDGEEIIDD